MNETENLKFRVAKFHFFHGQFDVEVHSREDAETYAGLSRPSTEVSSVVEIFNMSVYDRMIESSL
jgi:hypothetical protein